MRNLIRPLAAAAAATVLAMYASQSQALIVVGTTTDNELRPSPDPGWDHVGMVGPQFGTGVYLGSQYVLTAYHVGGFGITLRDPASPSTTKLFATDGSASVRLTDPSNGGGSDLILYRLGEDPQLPKLKIAASTPAIGSEVTMIGTGVDRGAVLNSGGFQGWYWGDDTTRKKLWGKNKINDTWVANGDLIADNGPFGRVHFLTTAFDSAGPGVSTEEAQAADKDSGGALFRLNGSQWELLGTMLAVGAFTNQPASSAAYGNVTGYADLSVYRNQILPYSHEIPGDANHDGIVNVSDLGALGLHWNQSGAGFAGGDFNRSGLVDVSDLGLLGLNWGNSVFAGAAPPSMTFAEALAMTQIPEPGAALGVAGAALVLLRRTRRA